MEEFFVKNISDVLKNRDKLERKLNVKLKIYGKKVIIEGESLSEYESSLVFRAISFGFSVKIALLLLDEENSFKVVHIRGHTRRKLKDVQARLIGTEGKTKRILADIANCFIVINEGEVGVIGGVEDVENTETAIINLIKGSKQTNMYRYLERMNRIKKESSFNF